MIDRAGSDWLWPDSSHTLATDLVLEPGRQTCQGTVPPALPWCSRYTLPTLASAGANILAAAIVAVSSKSRSAPLRPDAR